jgi:hypothetical protein
MLITSRILKFSFGKDPADITATHSLCIVTA